MGFFNALLNESPKPSTTGSDGHRPALRCIVSLRDVAPLTLAAVEAESFCLRNSGADAHALCDGSDRSG